MVFNAGEKLTCLQYLIFYESLEDLKKAYNLYGAVSTELDTGAYDDCEEIMDLQDNFDNDPLEESPLKLAEKVDLSFDPKKVRTSSEEERELF